MNGVKTEPETVDGGGDEVEGSSNRGQAGEIVFQPSWGSRAAILPPAPSNGHSDAQKQKLEQEKHTW